MRLYHSSRTSLFISFTSKWNLFLWIFVISERICVLFQQSFSILNCGPTAYLLNSYNRGIVWNINVWMYCMNSLKKTFIIHKGYIRSKGITLREKHGPLTPPLTFLWWQTASLISKNPNTAIDVLPSYWWKRSLNIPKR